MSLCFRAERRKHERNRNRRKRRDHCSRYERIDGCIDETVRVHDSIIPESDCAEETIPYCSEQQQKTGSLFESSLVVTMPVVVHDRFAQSPATKATTQSNAQKQRTTVGKRRNKCPFKFALRLQQWWMRPQVERDTDMSSIQFSFRSEYEFDKDHEDHDSLCYTMESVSLSGNQSIDSTGSMARHDESETVTDQSRPSLPVDSSVVSFLNHADDSYYRLSHGEKKLPARLWECLARGA